MKNAHFRKDDFAPLRPVGLAFAAVVAGIGAGKAEAAEPRAHAPLEPPAQSNSYVIDPTNHPGFEEDARFVVEASEPVAPFAPMRKDQRDLFE
jgi:hypothetical protein